MWGKKFYTYYTRLLSILICEWSKPYRSCKPTEYYQYSIRNRYIMNTDIKFDRFQPWLEVTLCM